MPAAPSRRPAPSSSGGDRRSKRARTEVPSELYDKIKPHAWNTTDRQRQLDKSRSLSYLCSMGIFLNDQRRRMAAGHEATGPTNTERIRELQLLIDTEEQTD